MSGAEVLALVTGVMTVVTFGVQVVGLCKSIHDGRPDADESLLENAASLSKATGDLDKYCNTFVADSADRKELQRLANNCRITAMNLHAEVQKIRSKATKGKYHRPPVDALRSFISRPKLEKWKKELQDYEMALQTGLLVRIWTRDDAAALEQSREFVNLQEQVKAFVSKYAAGNLELGDLTRSEHTDTRTHTTAEVRATENAIKTHVSAVSSIRVSEAQRERILQSLKFPGMNERYNHITETHKGTFQWALEPPDDAEWPSFLEWLQSEGEQKYWLSGLPGSGKSTLVKFLVDNPRTSLALKKWRGSCRILKHCFWKPGNLLQRNLRGFWASLAYQLLLDAPDSLASVLQASPSASAFSEPADWSLGSLRQVCFNAMSGRPLCIFVDGLDEIDDDDGADGIVEAVDQIICQLGDDVKFCLASRPEPRFRRRLAGVSKLELHLLTEKDMKRLVDSKLSMLKLVKPLGPYSFNEISHITSMLIHRAEGVILWLVLALKSVVKGLEHQDAFDEIYTRIQQLPQGLYELYTDMWNRLNEDKPIYHKTAARIFRLVLAHEEVAHEDATVVHARLIRFISRLTLLDVAFGSQLRLHRLHMHRQWTTGLSGTTELCSEMEHIIRTRCAGILKVSDGDFVPSRGITFIHRTAYDYLTTTEHGRTILAIDTLPQAYLHLHMAQTKFSNHQLLQRKRPGELHLDGQKHHAIVSLVLYHLAMALNPGNEHQVYTTLDYLFNYAAQKCTSYPIIHRTQAYHFAVCRALNHRQLWPYLRLSLEAFNDGGAHATEVLRVLVNYLNRNHVSWDARPARLPIIEFLVQNGADPTSTSTTSNPGGRSIIYEWLDQLWNSNPVGPESKTRLEALTRVINSSDDLLETLPLYWSTTAGSFSFYSKHQISLDYLLANQQNSSRLEWPYVLFVFKATVSYRLKYQAEALTLLSDPGMKRKLDILCSNAPDMAEQLVGIVMRGEDEDLVVLRCTDRRHMAPLLRSMMRYVAASTPEDRDMERRWNRSSGSKRLRLIDLSRYVLRSILEAEEYPESIRDTNDQLAIGNLLPEIRQARDAGVLEEYSGSVRHLLLSEGVTMDDLEDECPDCEKDAELDP